MTEVEVRQVAGSSFLARGPSNHWVPIDAPVDEQGQDAGARPMELLLMALGGCTGIDVVLMLKKIRVPIDDLQIKLSGERAEEPPRSFTAIKISYHFWGNDLPLAKLQRAVEMSQEKYCSVAHTITQAANISSEIITHQPGEAL